MVLRWPSKNQQQWVVQHQSPHQLLQRPNRLPCTPLLQLLQKDPFVLNRAMANRCKIWILKSLFGLLDSLTPKCELRWCQSTANHNIREALPDFPMMYRGTDVPIKIYMFCKISVDCMNWSMTPIRDTWHLLWNTISWRFLAATKVVEAAPIVQIFSAEDSQFNLIPIAPDG